MFIVLVFVIESIRTVEHSVSLSHSCRTGTVNLQVTSTRNCVLNKADEESKMISLSGDLVFLPSTDLNHVYPNCEERFKLIVGDSGDTVHSQFCISKPLPTTSHAFVRS